jgi:hypothetical protein
MKCLVVAQSILMVSASSPCFSQPTTSSQAAAQDADEAFRSGNALMAESKYCEALSRYQAGFKSEPDDTSLLTTAAWRHSNASSTLWL